MSFYPGINMVLRPYQRSSLVQCIMVNSEAFNWSTAEKKCPQSTQPQTGHRYHTPASQDSGVTTGEGAKRLSEPEVWEGGSESVTSGCDWCCLPKVKAVYNLLWNGEQFLTVDGFREKENQFCPRMWPLAGQSSPSGCPHTCEYTDSTHWTWVIKKGTRKSKGRTWSWDRVKVGSWWGWGIGSKYICMHVWNSQRINKILCQNIWYYCFSGLNYIPSNSSGKTVASPQPCHCTWRQSIYGWD